MEIVKFGFLLLFVIFVFSCLISSFCFYVCLSFYARLKVLINMVLMKKEEECNTLLCSCSQTFRRLHKRVKEKSVVEMKICKKIRKTNKLELNRNNLTFKSRTLTFASAGFIETRAS